MNPASMWTVGFNDPGVLFESCVSMVAVTSYERWSDIFIMGHIKEKFHFTAAGVAFLFTLCGCAAINVTSLRMAEYTQFVAFNFNSHKVHLATVVTKHLEGQAGN